MTIEVGVPEDWTPELTLTMAQLLHRAFGQGFPVIAFVSKDVTPDQLRILYRRVQDLIEEAGLQP
jgi:hypothetical protein